MRSTAAARAAARRRRARRRRAVRGGHRCRWSRPRPRLAFSAATPRRRSRTRCAPRSRCCARRCCPGSRAVAAYNVARGRGDVALFEIGRVFLAPPEAERAARRAVDVAVVLAGSVRRRPVEPDRPVDVYDAVDLVRAVVDALGVADGRLEPEAVPGLDPAASARVVRRRPTGRCRGRARPGARRGVGLAAPAVALRARPRRARSGAARRPAVPGPVAVPAVGDRPRVRRRRRRRPPSVDGDAARRRRRRCVEDVRCFDEFRAEQLGAGRRSLAFSLRFRAPDRTLTDAEVARAPPAGHRRRRRRPRGRAAGLTSAPAASRNGFRRGRRPLGLPRAFSGTDSQPGARRR